MTQERFAARILLTPRPNRPKTVALEVAFLGHCPGRVNVDRLLAMPTLLDELERVGFGDHVRQLQSGVAQEPLASLSHLPIPIYSRAEFHDLFPSALNGRTQYQSVLAGGRPWLAPCVDDFFANGGVKLWVVKIPEDERQAGFFPTEQTQLHDVQTLRGLATLFILPRIGTVACPDLERLQIPAQLPDVPRVRLANPDPQFRPCAQVYNQVTQDNHRERRHSNELPDAPDPLPFSDVLKGLLQRSAKARPDWQWVLSLPLSYAPVAENAAQSPQVDPTATEWLEQLKQRNDAHRLRQLQLVFPYLRAPDRPLRSSVGIITGKQAAMAQREGIWVSVAEAPLVASARPFPHLSLSQALDLRHAPGVSVLRFHRGALRLDDERLCVPALPPEDINTGLNDRRYGGYRSAEVQRFLGYLQRSLRALGEQLIFNVDYRDPRPRLILDTFFRNLYQRGALRGRTVDEAFHIQPHLPASNESGDGVMVFEIAIAPALPIERIRLTFSNARGAWKTSGGTGDV
ncbi:hypothetical protein [Marinibactrum halimedae]|uniref:Phage tail sheath family protein n=1 Tax=Marinibactrum halimedae TaxID=1444977 RepID=A0AA37WQX4_9GAMM|nr:hypothetical protein [Marinibactrum halimedae]MCD9460631.1 hypothetical protein [Marinibactrum halimedae]GLS27847.1 hypothetical protein GCM10007877_35660 [Marinibactrum halimedae]